MNEIDIKHINHLSDIQLSKLLHTLIKLEAEKNNLQDWDGIVPFNITTGDAGSDGRIQWNGTPAQTHWLKNKFTIFQNKATDLFPGDCIEEIFPTTKAGQPRKLKAQIEKVVKANGCYILFTNRPIVDNGKDERIAKFREAIQLAGEPNYATFQILVYDSNSIKNWVNENIGAVTLVQAFNDIHRHQGFIEWEKWEILSRATDNKFQIDETVKGNIALIQKSISTEKVIRITGHSGLGKTRLVLESFRGIGLQKSVVYLNLEGSLDITEIKNYILSYQDSQDGIIVIDNCDVKSHMILSGIAKPTGNLKIITIGLDDSNSIQDLKIRVERNKQRELVKEIVQNKIGSTHQLSDIEYITTISEGYPWMAIRFCDVVIKQGMSELSKIPIDQFIPRLIFGSRPEDEIERGIIRACSVFSAFGFLDDSFSDVINKEFKDSLKAQMNFIRTRIYDGTITETKFKETCTKFLNDDIIERRGTYYIVKPTILAINLAADWLLHTDKDKIIEIIQELKEVKLEDKFLERLTDLDQLDKAKDIVKELWGANASFSSAEVLNTSWGSLLFRYVVEVNPVATANALETSFGKMTKDEILKIEEGRRNLVWALEKLCFRKETFNTAAKILYSFAVSENETWGNNSTNQFRQLFQLFLSGTEASLKERLEIIKWGLGKNDDDYTQIAIQAMGRGLINDHYTRMGGAEKQGSSVPLQDYYPTWNEIREYWFEIISILTEIAVSKSTHSELAQEKIAHSIRSLLRDRESKIVIDSIRKIIAVRGNLWTEALNNLRMTLGFEKHLPKDIVDEINLLIVDLTPTDTKNQLLLKVTKPEWDTYEKDDENNYIDKPKLNAEAFAQKLFDEKTSWIEYISDLLQGEQRQAFAFGSKVGELTTDKENLIDIAVKALQNIKKENQNSELIAGILFGSKSKMLSEKTIDRFIETEEIRQHAFYLTRVVGSNYSDIEKLFLLVDKFGFSINLFQNFQYGRALDILTNEEVLKLCDKISQYGNSGKWTALSLLYMFCYSSEEKWNLNKDYFKKLIGSSNMTIDNDGTGRMESYHWSDAVIKILTKDNDENFAITITKQIIEFCSQRHLNYSFDTYISNTILHLFEKYFDSTWEYFGNGIIGDYMTFFHLEHMIGTRNGYLGGREGIVFRDPNHYPTILAWCRQHPEIAPERIAHMMPLSVNENDQIKWHPFSKAIIDEFGDNEKLIRQLSSNMGTFGTVGSRVPYFQTQKQLLQELINHPIQRVSDWAKGMLEYTEKTIKIEKLDDEQQFLS
ncbi:MAG: hypothetical protein JSS64_04390 [Bacteroidetes bacterium]|nr:hypothetical protein [Bacteroidota bacterium]